MGVPATNWARRAAEVLHGQAVREAIRTIPMRPPRPRPSGRYAVRSET